MFVRIHTHRLGNIWCGYSLSVIAAGSAISAVIATMTALGPNGFPNYDLAGKIGGAVSLAMLFAVFAIPVTFVLALLPAAAVVLYAEPHEVRSPLAYAFFGVLVAVVSVAGAIILFELISYRPSRPARITPLAETLLQLAPTVLTFVLPGLCGGLTYWAKSGRHAGD
jgi:hypothetical protein